jgi:hypothetical protein
MASFRTNLFDRAFDSYKPKSRIVDKFGSAFMPTSLDEEEDKPLTRSERIASATSQNVVKGQEYDALLADGPDKEKMKSSTGRKLAAILAGGLSGFANPGSGYEIADMIAGAPRRRVMEEYTDKVDRAKTSAGNERTKLNDAFNTINAEEDDDRYNKEQDRLDRGEEREDVKLKDDLLTSNINRANTNDAIISRGFQFIQSEGNLIAINIKEGTSEVIAKIGKSPEEQAEAARIMAAYTNRLAEGTQTRLLNQKGELDAENDERTANAKMDQIKEQNAAKLQIAADKLSAQVGKMPNVDEQMKIRFRDVLDAISQSGLDPEDVVEIGELGMKTKGPSFFSDDSPELKALKERVRGILGGGNTPGDFGSVSAPDTSSSNQPPPPGATPRPSGPGWEWKNGIWGRVNPGGF